MPLVVQPGVRRSGRNHGGGGGDDGGRRAAARRRGGGHALVVARRPEGEAEQELVVVVVLAAAVLGAGKGSVVVLLGAVRVHGSVAVHDDLLVLALGFSGGRGLRGQARGETSVGGRDG
jgi:hypothetical protein